MGFLDGLMGNSSEMSLEKAQDEFKHLLAEGERIEKAYKVIRDLFIFTDKRLILLDKQGITGKKIDILSIPYRSVTHFSVETAGNFDLDAELKIWISGTPEPIGRQFNKSTSIYEVQSVLAAYVLK